MNSLPFHKISAEEKGGTFYSVALCPASALGQNGAVDKVPEIKRQGRFQARKKMPFGITLSI